VRYPGFDSKSAFFYSIQSLFSVLLAEIPQPKTPVLLGLRPVVLFFQMHSDLSKKTIRKSFFKIICYQYTETRKYKTEL
jgi:hypothetical protein